MSFAPLGPSTLLLMDRILQSDRILFLRLATETYESSSASLSLSVTHFHSSVLALMNQAEDAHMARTEDKMASPQKSARI